MAMNIGTHESFQIKMLVFSECTPRNGTAGSHGIALFLVFEGNFTLLSWVAAPLYASTNSIGGRATVLCQKLWVRVLLQPPAAERGLLWAPSPNKAFLTSKQQDLVWPQQTMKTEKPICSWAQDRFPSDKPESYLTHLLIVVVLKI